MQATTGKIRKNVLSAAILVMILFLFSTPARANTAVRPSSVNFGNQTVGTTSAPVTVTLTNSNKHDFTIASVSLSGAQFSYSGPSMPVTLPSGQSLTVYVTFTPAVAQICSGMLVFTRANGATITDTLSGTGISTQPQPPAITKQPSNQSVLAGQSATFSVSATGTAPLGYQWKKNGIAITGASSATYTLPSATTSDSNSQFAVTVANLVGDASSNAAMLTVVAPVVAPSITMQPTNQSITAGQTATFSAVAAGTSPMTYQWIKNSSPISGATSSTYTTPAETTSDNNATFAVAVSNSAGSATSGSALLTVISASYSVSGSVSPSASGTGTTLTLSGTSGATATADSSGNYSFTGLANGSYTVTPTKSGFTFNPTSAPVIVNSSNVTVAAFAATANAAGQTLFTTQVPAQVGQTDGVSVNYDLGTMFQSNTTGVITSIRFWKDTNESGAHSGNIWSGAGQLMASVTFVNETASGWQQQALATPLAIAANTPYVVSVNTGNTFYAATASGLASQVINGNLSSVVGNNGVFGPTGTLPTNSWQTSNYFRDVVFIPSNTPVAPTITTQPAGKTITAGQTATFSVAAVGTAPMTYQWMKNSIVITGATSSSYTTPAETTADNNAQFSVTVTNGVGNATSNAAALTVNAAAVAPAITTQPSSQTVNSGQTATFNIAATGTSPMTYQWKKNSTSITGATSSTYTTPATTSSDSGAQFSVVLSNSAGSATSTAATLTVNTVAVAPSITSQPVSKTVVAGQTATFSVAASGTSPMTYQWMKNSVAISGATSSSYTTPAETTADNNALFSVTVTNSMGNATSNSATLTVSATTLVLSSSVSALNFGSVNIPTGSTKNVTLTNAGNSTITISSVTVNGAGFNASGVPTGTMLNPGQTATLAVSFSPSGAGSVTGNASVASNASNSPDAITLSGTGVTVVNHSASLSWTPSTSTVMGYNTYSATTSGGPYTKLTSAPNAANSYTDSTVQAGLTYYYVVTTVDTSGMESAFSTEVSALIP